MNLTKKERRLLQDTAEFCAENEECRENILLPALKKLDRLTNDREWEFPLNIQFRLGGLIKKLQKGDKK